MIFEISSRPLQQAERSFNVASTYIPDRGDIVWISQSPAAASEMHRQHLALVLSPSAVNQRGHAFIVPVMNTKGHPVLNPPLEGTETVGFLAPMQMRSFDFETKGLAYKEKAPEEVVNLCANLFKTFLAIPET